MVAFALIVYIGGIIPPGYLSPSVYMARRGEGAVYMNIISMILSLLCGVALFLFGMQLMGDGLKSVAGNQLETFLYRMTSNPVKGVLLGAGVIYFRRKRQ